jgi:transposase-like protein
LPAVVMQAWVEGVSTRKVEDLVAALGLTNGKYPTGVTCPKHQWPN